MNYSPPPTTVRTAANVATLALALASFFQLLLALGMLPVTMAWGGSQQELTPWLRIASIVAAAILVAFAYVIRRRAGLMGTGPVGRTIKVLAWVITVYLFLNSLANLASPSFAEKLIFAPISAVAAVSSLIVTMAKTSE